MKAEFLLLREVNNTLTFGKFHSTNFYPHFHSNIEIYLVTSGQLEVFINNRRKTLGPGELSVAFSYDVHSYNTLGDSEGYFIIIPTSFCGDILPQLSSKRTGSPFIDDPNTYNTVLNCLEKITAGTNDVSTRGYVYVMLGTILDQRPVEASTDAQDTLLSAEILIYLSKHFREELTLSSLALKFGYNTSYLSRSFHNTIGISFGKYVTMLRLRESILLLHKGGMSVTECALESGFGSMRSFYRAFQDEFGCTPKEYLNAEQKRGTIS